MLKHIFVRRKFKKQGVNKIILSIIFILIISSYQAQTLRMGLLLGYNNTSLTNSNISSLGSQLGYLPSYSGSFGVTGVYNIDDSYLNISSGFIYTGANQKYTGVELSGQLYHYNTLSAETKLKYLDFPILFRVGDIVGFYGEIGPQFSFLLSSSSTVSFEPADSAHLSSSGTYSSDFSGFVFSGVIGGGFTFIIQKKYIIDVGFRVSYGLSDVTNSIQQTDTTSHSITGTYANYTRYVYNKTANYGYTPTNRVSEGVYITLTFLIEGDTKFNKRFK